MLGLHARYLCACAPESPQNARSQLAVQLVELAPPSMPRSTIPRFSRPGERFRPFATRRRRDAGEDPGRAYFFAVVERLWSHIVEELEMSRPPLGHELQRGGRHSSPSPALLVDRETEGLL